VTLDLKGEGKMDIGKYVIVRSSPSGCWAGTLASIDGGGDGDGDG
jgi:hypothetical protein